MLCLMLGTAVVGAGDSGTLPVPPEPVGGVLDDARVFETAQERLGVLQNRIESTSQLTGIPVRVAVFDTLIGRTLAEEAARLREAWLGGGAGVLLVIESDSGRWQVVWADGGPVPAEGMPAVPGVGPGVVPGPEQLRIEERMRSLGVPGQRSVEDTERLVMTLVEGVETAVAEEARPGGWTKEVVVMVIGLLAAILLAAMLGWAWVRRHASRARERMVFPEVSIGRRLGAPYGGGKVTARRFRVSSS